jgi:DNA-binding HxlR family transcriptional regulator
MTARYDQFCALARAAELLGERWTLLIIRELMLGPKRFSDLKERLDGISASVLSQRLSALGRDGLIERAYLPPPAASNVLQLTENGRALEPAVYELIRWGGRFLMPPRPGERREPDWTRLVFQAYARKGRVPRRSFEVHVIENGAEAVFGVTGTAQGTRIEATQPDAEVRFSAGFETLLGLISGRLDSGAAIREGLIAAEGDIAALRAFPAMFDQGR